MRFYLLYIIFFFNNFNISAQVNFSKSNLPIIMINTNGKQIQDEPKIVADMKIIYKDTGLENHITDPANEYNGKIGIELRGSSSQSFPKLPYGFETLNEDLEDSDVKLLGMPKESDWTLNATYNDKTLMRDGLAYIFAGSIMNYAPRVRYTELMLNNQYQGIYLLIEKIKRDKNRVDISKMETTDNDGDAVTGGYIIKIDKESGSNSGDGWFSTFKPFNGAWQNTFFQYETPKATEITFQQKTYVRNHMVKVENSIAASNYKDPINGYRKYVDTKSLIDYIIINELSKNVDAYRLSTFFYKEKDSNGGKIKFGPVWDYNLGFGNADYCTQGNPEGLVLLNFNEVCSEDGWVIHFWWKKFLQDESFYNELKIRWKDLRKKQFSETRINFVIDSISTMLAQSQVRNFQKWPVLGQYVWPNFYVGKTYSDEVNYLKNWIKNRLAYLDKVWDIKVSNNTDFTETFLTIAPNPASEIITLSFKYSVPDDTEIQIFDSHGIKLSQIPFSRFVNKIEVNINHLPPGFYLINVHANKETHSYKFIKN